MNLKEFMSAMADAIEISNHEELTEETQFRNLDEWSSISVMLLIAFFDSNFGKAISVSDIKQCKTIHDLYELSK